MNVPSLVSLELKDDWRSFANKLFELEDADPGYMMLARAKLTYAQKLRYVLAWCTFYNIGVAATACGYEGWQFYAYLRSVYPTAKRGSERRHFRGQAGLKAIKQWQEKYPKPEAMIEACFGATYLDVRKNMKCMAQMGDYFYWKMADIQDTVFHEPVDFTGCEKYMPNVPKQGADMIAELESTCFVLPLTMCTVTKHVSTLCHPFKPRRPLALQEAETVCCVFKQHVAGKYKFGFRSAKAWNSLLQAPDAGAAGLRLRDGLYAGGVWSARTLYDVAKYL